MSDYSALKRPLLITTVAVAGLTGGFVGVQAALDDPTPQNELVSSVVPAEASAPTAAAIDLFAPESESNDNPSEFTPVTAADVQAALAAQATSLADCPEALEFLTRPDIKSFYLLNFGHDMDPEHTWLRGCPAGTELQKSYEASRQRLLAEGVLK